MRERTGLAVTSAVVIVCLLGITSKRQNTVAQGTARSDNKQVQILGQGVELIEMTPTAEKCGKQKGTTTRLRVTSETPVDVRLYVQVGYKRWLNKDFANQKRGDEITDYMCDRKPTSKVYARAAGTSEEWPKP